MNLVQISNHPINTEIERFVCETVEIDKKNEEIIVTCDILHNLNGVRINDLTRQKVLVASNTERIDAEMNKIPQFIEGAVNPAWEAAFPEFDYLTAIPQVEEAAILFDKIEIIASSFILKRDSEGVFDDIYQA